MNLQKEDMAEAPHPHWQSIMVGHSIKSSHDFRNLPSSAIMVNSDNSRKDSHDQGSASSNTKPQVGLVIDLPCPHRRILGGGSDDDSGEKMDRKMIGQDNVWNNLSECMNRRGTRQV
jgi:hypothetical protein